MYGASRRPSCATIMEVPTASPDSRSRNKNTYFRLRGSLSSPVKLRSEWSSSRCTWLRSLGRFTELRCRARLSTSSSSARTAPRISDRSMALVVYHDASSHGKCREIQNRSAGRREKKPETAEKTGQKVRQLQTFMIRSGRRDSSGLDFSARSGASSLCIRRERRRQGAGARYGCRHHRLGPRQPRPTDSPGNRGAVARHGGPHREPSLSPGARPAAAARGGGRLVRAPLRRALRRRERG